MITIKEKINSENSLWANFVNGNQEAFAKIYNQHINSLYAYGFKLCPNKDLINDCIHDSFIDLFEHRSQISKPSNVKFYLFKVLKHTIYRKLKKERKFVEISMRKDNMFQTEYCTEKKIINAEIESSRKLLIHKTVKKLSSKQQEILYLRFTMGFEYLEISEIVKIDHNSVRKQVYRAIKKLRESEVFKKDINIFLFLRSI